MRKREQRWRQRLMGLSELAVVGPWAVRLAELGLPPLYGTVPLSRLHHAGYVSPRARIAHPRFRRGQHCYVGDRVLVYQDRRGGDVELGDRVHLHEENVIQTGQGGSVRIGDDTHVQPRCQLSAYCGAVEIGKRVEIAPRCAFYPYNHGFEAGRPIQSQPLYTRSGISVGDDAWLGYGVILLDDAHVGAGAVIGAGSVVNTTVPPNAIAAGAPARVVGYRSAAEPRLENA